MRVSPSTILAGAALFFALGGSAVAVTDAVRPQPRCQPGAVRGYIAVNGDPAKGIANIGDAFTSARSEIGARFNCAGAAPAVTGVLLFHVAHGRRDAAAVISSTRIRMLNKQFTTISSSSGRYYVNNAQIVATDVFASNGVIHAIDSVLLPS